MNHIDRAKQYLEQTYHLVEISGLRINGVQWTEIMAEFAQKEKESEEQQFAEWCSKNHYTFDFIGERWYRLIEDSAGETVKESCTTSELYNGPYREYKERK